MRPLILTITAFGPYATEQIIDFNELQGRNLFVITGDTGAGKTTILDAISYALYGKASGRDRDGENLRSHFATSDLLTSVELEFELQGERYLVKRIPKQRKKKTRGEGYTDQNAEAEFKNLSGEVRVVSGVKEVDEKIVDLMGLNYHQFKQIIMIPQGEFRELLNADSKARQDILQKIFGTEGLRRIQELFESEAKGLMQEVAMLESQQNECIRSLDGSSYLPLTEILKQTSYNAALVVDEAKQAIACDVSSSNELQQLIHVKEQQVVDKQGEIFAGKANNIKISNCELANEHKISLEAKQPENDEKKCKLAQAKKATEVTVIAEYRHNRTINVQKKKALLVKAEQQKQLAQATVNAAEIKYQQEKANDNKRSELVAGQARLNELVVKVADLDAGQNNLVKAELALKNAQKMRDAVKQELHETRDESAICQVRLDEAKVALTEYGRKLIELEKIDELCSKFRTLQVESNCLIKLGQTMLTLKHEASKAHLQYEQSQTDYEKAQQLFYEGQAGNLAFNLKMGEKCPVCGSEDHPKLAVMLASNISEEKLKKIHTKSKQMRETYDLVKSNYERNNGDHYAQEQILARHIKELSILVTDNLTNLSLVELAKYSDDKCCEYQILKKDLETELAKLVSYKNTESEIAMALTQKVLTISKLALKLEELEQVYTTLFAKVQSAKDAINKLESEIPMNVRSSKLLAIEIQRIQDQLTISQQAMNKAQEEQTSSKVSYATAMAEKNAAKQALQEEILELNIATQKFMTALLTAGFAEEVDYETAKLTAEQMANLEQQINNYQEALRSAVDAHAKAEVEVKGIIAANISALEVEQQNFQAEKNILIASRTNIMARQIHNETMLTSICNIMQKITTCADEHQLIGHLAKIAKGDNEQKVSFERYVLAAFFNDIIDAANVRLKKMTGGRYQMSRIVQKSKGNAQSGLEIEVFDYYTGQSRHVKTLSGGESFKASLALALGLAQVVQSYAGGISLETMFVDEGFGTLDPESLDTAISCLIDLQNSGRLVGIISHVPELKTNIDARLEIEACKDGSRAKFYIS